MSPSDQMASLALRQRDFIFNAEGLQQSGVEALLTAWGTQSPQQEGSAVPNFQSRVKSETFLEERQQLPRRNSSPQPAASSVAEWKQMQRNEQEHPALSLSTPTDTRMPAQQQQQQPYIQHKAAAMQRPAPVQLQQISEMRPQPIQDWQVEQRQLHVRLHQREQQVAIAEAQLAGQPGSPPRNQANRLAAQWELMSPTAMAAATRSSMGSVTAVSAPASWQAAASMSPGHTGSTPPQATGTYSPSLSRRPSVSRSSGRGSAMGQYLPRPDSARPPCHCL